MTIGNLYHSGFISSIKYDSLTPWLTTTSDNQVIEFKDGSGNVLRLNSLLIEAEATDLYIRILPSDSCLFIPAGESRSYEFEDVSSIQIMCPLGTKLRYSGLYF